MDIEDFRISRIKAVREQHERAALFYREATESDDQVDRFRRLIAATYFCRAALEIMYEGAKAGDLTIEEKPFRKRMEEMLPRSNLIYKIRIHDFHRFGVSEYPGLSLMGPIALSARNGGMAQVQLTSRGIETRTSGEATVDFNRPLVLKEDKILDDTSGEFVSLLEILGEYIEALPQAIRVFESLHPGAR